MKLMYGNTSNAYQLYKQTDINTANSGKLLLMLYDGAIKFCRFSEIAMDEKDYDKKNTYLMRVQDIITELTVTLNSDAGDISKNLSMLYNYMESELIEANIKNDKDKVIWVRNMLENLRMTWAQIIN